MAGPSFSWTISSYIDYPDGKTKVSLDELNAKRLNWGLALGGIAEIRTGSQQRLGFQLTAIIDCNDFDKSEVHQSFNTLTASFMYYFTPEKN